MAFSWAGDLGGGSPIHRRLPIGATLYQGQLLGYDTSYATNGGAVITTANAAAGPDTTSFVMGICAGLVSNKDRTFNTTYKGDTLTYTTTQATIAALDPADCPHADVILVTPLTLIHAPVVKDTVGTAPECITNTAASSGGVTITHSAIDTTIDGYSTLYCRTGANRGLQRRVTTVTSTSIETVVIPFPYAIAVGDTFCVVNVVLGNAHIAWDTQFQGIDSSAALSNYFKAYVHELNLAEAGKEYAVFSLSASHCAIGGTGV
jgi:hypothetical protein